MSFETFAQLVNTEFSLRRSLHRSTPERRANIKRAIEAVHQRLRRCNRYDAFIARMARTADRLG